MSKMQELMSIIDENSHRIPEGDYIKMCECMKNLNKDQTTLRVTPDVVSEDFIMTSDAFNKCHKWIVAVGGLRDAYIDYSNDPDNDEKLGILRCVREACKTFWRELTQTQGYNELMWFVHRGTVAQRDFRHYCIKSNLS
jgi:hypothetical protein